MLPEVHKLTHGSLKPGTETIEELISGKGFFLEHILSRGDASDPDTWYDQEETEWVALISGKATLEFEEGKVQLTAGDALTIAPHQKHRVHGTSADAVWIALHFDESGS